MPLPTKTFTEARKERAKAMLGETTPKRISEDTFLVPSQTRKAEYIVKRNPLFTCSCPDYQSRCKDKGLYCKHILATIMFERLERKYSLEGKNASN